MGTEVSGGTDGLLVLAVFGSLLNMLAMVVVMVCGVRFVRAFERISESLGNHLMRPESMSPSVPQIG